jgi:hypothetical protein
MTDPDGGYFAPPLPVQPAQGYGPPPPVVPTPARPAGLPPLVVASATSLALAGIAALWLGLTMLIAGGTFGDYESGHLGARGALLLVNGLANGALVTLLLRGLEPARWAATAICACWVVYWLYQDTRATHAFAQIGFGAEGVPGLHGLTFMATLGLLLLAGWAAATAAMLWTPAAARHFQL